ncbi:MAG: tetratricopeptide repeat protein [Bacteroidia bacterium]|nr:tetratricopeptide repeat protein [Bacteroidia bacterium]
MQRDYSMPKIQFLALTFLSILYAACGGGNQKLEQADGLRTQEKYAEALVIYQQLLDADPGLKEAYSGRGICQLYTDNAEGAMTDLNKAIELSGDAKYAQRKDYYEFRGIDFFFRGLLNAAIGDKNTAVSDFEMAVKYQYKPVESYLQLGIALGAIDQPIEAVDNFSKVLELDPKNLPALANRAFYLSVLGDNRRAIADFNTALEIDPTDKSTWVNRGYTWLGLNEAEKALADIEKSLELDPDYLAGLTYRGIALQHLNRNEEALQAFTAAIAKYPEYQKLWYGRGVAKISLGDIKGGCEDLAVAESYGDIEGEELRIQYCR